MNANSGHIRYVSHLDFRIQVQTYLYHYAILQLIDETETGKGSATLTKKKILMASSETQRSVIYLVLFLVLLTICVITMVYVVMDKSDTTVEPDDGDRTAWLFAIASDDHDHVSVKNEDAENSSRFVVSLPTVSSAVRMFSNIPKHISFSIGNLHGLRMMFNGSKNSKINVDGLDDKNKVYIDELINNRDSKFIEEQPNCTLSFTHYPTAEGVLEHSTTIAKMVQIQYNPETTYTDLSFVLLAGENHIAELMYQNVQITVDDFWDFTDIIGKSINTGAAYAGLGVACASTGGAVCAIAAIGVLGQSVSLNADLQE
jgi:hypothetical protein